MGETPARYRVMTVHEPFIEVVASDSIQDVQDVFERLQRVTATACGGNRFFSAVLTQLTPEERRDRVCKTLAAIGAPVKLKEAQAAVRTALVPALTAGAEEGCVEGTRLLLEAVAEVCVVAAQRQSEQGQLLSCDAVGPKGLVVTLPALLELAVRGARLCGDCAVSDSRQGVWAVEGADVVPRLRPFHDALSKAAASCEELLPQELPKARRLALNTPSISDGSGGGTPCAAAPTKQHAVTRLVRDASQKLREQQPFAEWLQVLLAELFAEQEARFRVWMEGPRTVSPSATAAEAVQVVRVDPAEAVEATKLEAAPAELSSQRAVGMKVTTKVSGAEAAEKKAEAAEAEAAEAEAAAEEVEATEADKEEAETEAVEAETLEVEAEAEETEAADAEGEEAEAKAAEAEAAEAEGEAEAAEAEAAEAEGEAEAAEAEAAEAEAATEEVEATEADREDAEAEAAGAETLDFEAGAEETEAADAEGEEAEAKAAEAEAAEAEAEAEAADAEGQEAEAKAAEAEAAQAEAEAKAAAKATAKAAAKVNQAGEAEESERDEEAEEKLDSVATSRRGSVAATVQESAAEVVEVKVAVAGVPAEAARAAAAPSSTRRRCSGTASQSPPPTRRRDTSPPVQRAQRSRRRQLASSMRDITRCAEKWDRLSSDILDRGAVAVVGVWSEGPFDSLLSLRADMLLLDAAAGADLVGVVRGAVDARGRYCAAVQPRRPPVVAVVVSAAGVRAGLVSTLSEAGADAVALPVPLNANATTTAALAECNAASVPCIALLDPSADLPAAVASLRDRAHAILARPAAASHTADAFDFVRGASAASDRVSLGVLLPPNSDVQRAAAASSGRRCLVGSPDPAAIGKLRALLT